MNDRAARIDALARQFSESAHALCEELAGHLGHQDPELAAKVAEAVVMGEAMMLCLKIDPVAPEIAWFTVNDYQTTRRILTIPGKVPARH